MKLFQGSDSKFDGPLFETCLRTLKSVRSRKSSAAR